MSNQTMPEQTIPEQTMSNQTMPEQTIPEQTISNQTMPNIETISPNNNFSVTEKNILNTYVTILNQSMLPTNGLKFIGKMMMAIGIYKDNMDLVSWVLTNNYLGGNDIINSSHIAFANQMGFNIEVEYEQDDIDEDAISSLYIDSARHNYARFRNLDIKDVTESMVKKSSAGLEGWYEYDSGEDRGTYEDTVLDHEMSVPAPTSEPSSDDDLEEVD